MAKTLPKGKHFNFDLVVTVGVTLDENTKEEDARAIAHDLLVDTLESGVDMNPVFNSNYHPDPESYGVTDFLESPFIGVGGAIQEAITAN